MNDVMKIIKALEYSIIMLKGVAKSIKNQTREQKDGLLGILLGNLGASLLANMLEGKGIVRAGYDNKQKGIKQRDGVISTSQDRGIVRAGYGCKMDY